VFGEAFFAVDGFAGGWFEGDLTGFAATGAFGFKHFFLSYYNSPRLGLIIEK
jgi:hypothetical protein